MRSYMDDPDRERANPLSPREQEVAKLVAEAHTTEEIAAAARDQPQDRRAPPREHPRQARHARPRRADALDDPARAGGAVIRVAIADDHHAVRLGLHAAIRSEPGLVPVGAASDGGCAGAAAAHHRPRRAAARLPPARHRRADAVPAHQGRPAGARGDPLLGLRRRLDDRARAGGGRRRDRPQGRAGARPVRGDPRRRGRRARAAADLASRCCARPARRSIPRTCRCWRCSSTARRPADIAATLRIDRADAARPHHAHARAAEGPGPGLTRSLLRMPPNRGGSPPSSTRSIRARSPTPTATGSATSAASARTWTTSRRSGSTCCGCRRSTPRRRTTTATTSPTTRTSTRCSGRSRTSTRCSPTCTRAACG